MIQYGPMKPQILKIIQALDKAKEPCLRIDVDGKFEHGYQGEGSIQKAGNQVRVIAQLIKASDGSHLWSENFDRDLEDIFAIQDEIAQKVVAALKIKLLDTEEERLTQRY